VKARLLFVFGALVLQGCGTLTYTPTEWPIKDGAIERLDVAGSVSFVNAQPSTEEAIVYSYGGTQLGTTYHAVTALMTRQAEKELKKNSGASRSGQPKTIELKVTQLKSIYIAFFWKSNMEYEARLGNGEVLNKSVKHGSGDVRQDLNGCIAEGVIDLFKDPRVKEYLAM